MVFSGMLLADFLFRIYLFPLYNNFLLKIGANPAWSDLDVGFAPIVWLSFFAIILGKSNNRYHICLPKCTKTD